jgi:tRNA pseudouridine13 synthase
MSTTRERDDDDILGPLPKKSRTETIVLSEEPQADSLEPAVQPEETPPTRILPPSHALLVAPRHADSSEGSDPRILETDVGISEYVGRDIPKIEGIIKQRCVLA